MKIQLQQGRVSEIDADVLVVAGFPPETPRDRGLNDATAGWLEELYASGEFEGKACELAVLHRPAGMEGSPSGSRRGREAGKVHRIEMRRLGGLCGPALKAKSLRQIHFWLPSAFASPCSRRRPWRARFSGTLSPIN